MEAGLSTIDSPQVCCPQHTHVGRNSVPLQLASQQIVLESFQPKGSYFTEGERLTACKIKHTVQRTAINVCRPDSSFSLQLLDNQVHVSG
ncbi:unknown [Bacteroides sp. CAG:633]|nr:unknown [Bacteroides sp. CAG:633]